MCQSELLKFALYHLLRQWVTPRFWKGFWMRLFCGGHIKLTKLEHFVYYGTTFYYFYLLWYLVSIRLKSPYFPWMFWSQLKCSDSVWQNVVTVCLHNDRAPPLLLDSARSFQHCHRCCLTLLQASAFTVVAAPSHRCDRSLLLPHVLHYCRTAGDREATDTHTHTEHSAKKKWWKTKHGTRIVTVCICCVAVDAH